MEKKHKAQSSFIGTPSMKNARGGGKKGTEKTHVPQKSNANLDKKAHTQISSKTTHKPAETTKKTSIATAKEEVEKPPVKTEKPQVKVEKPPVKTEKPPVKTEKPPVKTEKQPTLTKSSTNTSIQSAIDSKKANEEKRDMNKKLDSFMDNAVEYFEFS